ncbi:MAG: wax ester/triacylglycerol synthase family O-acyltransferase [Calditrichaeota bacterium]|nr:MAG: wax ester/triacylglycerol synthase family O-acyltransferase [Calditrichota bacterium]
MAAKREPMSNVDTAWWRMEDPTNLMMITGVILFPEPLDYQKVKRLLEERLLRFNRFRQRVVESRGPLGGNPYWEVDPHFDWNYHLRQIRLPEPGDEHELKKVVSKYMSKPLDYNRPLWQFHIIRNFKNGSALLGRLHHCIGDGTALVRVLFSLTDPTPDMNDQAHFQEIKQAELEKAEEKKGLLSTLVDPFISAAEKMLHFGETALHEGMEALLNPSRVLDAARYVVNTAESISKLLLSPADPPTLFKGRLGIKKRAAWSRPVALQDVKTIGKTMGGTVNDVLLTAMTGSLRRYLIEKGQNVEGIEIRAAVPVNLRPPEKALELGNKFGLVFLPLPIGEADPVQRLNILHERMNQLKKSPEALLLFGLLQAVAMTPQEIQDLVVSIFAKKVTAVMTNVAGPPKTIYLTGVPIDNIFFWVPQSGRVGMGVSIFSYAGKVTLGVATDVGLVPHPEEIIEGFHQEFEALLSRIPRGERLTGQLTSTGPLHLQDSESTATEWGGQQRCQATTRKGTRCKNPAREGSQYCAVHQPRSTEDG